MPITQVESVATVVAHCEAEVESELPPRTGQSERRPGAGNDSTSGAAVPDPIAHGDRLDRPRPRGIAPRRPAGNLLRHSESCRLGRWLGGI